MQPFSIIARLWPNVPIVAALWLSGYVTDDAVPLGSQWAALSGAVDSRVVSFATAGSAASGGASFACSPGGAAQIGGLVDVQVAPVRVDVEVDLDFDDCSLSGNVVANGRLHVSRHLAIAGGEALRIETVYDGTIDFDGDAAVSCDVDVRALVDLDGGVLSVAGNFCGRSAAGLNIAITPHWRN
jgi:hypothetical protein